MSEALVFLSSLIFTTGISSKACAINGLAPHFAAHFAITIFGRHVYHSQHPSAILSRETSGVHIHVFNHIGFKHREQTDGVKWIIDSKYSSNKKRV